MSPRSFLDSGITKKQGYQRRERKKTQLFDDLKMGRCCKLNLIGTSGQIQDILLSADWNPSFYGTWFLNMEKAIKVAKDHRSIGVGLDNLLRPKGTSASVNLSVRLSEDIAFVIKKIYSEMDDISLQIANDWNLAEDVEKYLNARLN